MRTQIKYQCNGVQQLIESNTPCIRSSPVLEIEKPSDYIEF